MDCLQPPLEDSPPGRWHCPMCPPLVQGPDGMEYYPSPDQETQLPEDDEPEESMDPSSSQLHANKYNRKGKQKAVPIYDSDSDVDMDGGDEDGVSLVAAKNKRRKPYKKNRGKGGQNSGDDEVSSTAPGKRPRIHVTSPVASRPRMVVRLRLPAKGKGKGREDDDSQKGLFDDILGVDDRDTTKTAVEFGDKQRFERSRLVAEVRSLNHNAQPPNSNIVFDSGKARPSAPTSSRTGSLTCTTCKFLISTPSIIHASSHQYTSCCVHSRDVCLASSVHSRAFFASELTTFTANTNHSIWRV
jgi:hypothetical protein